ncbi:hypothetical protein [Dokdonella sp.]|uniref:hypothetical protein n=1 Tax=Dokdonella sp. TaxID=2291710 RepID=UPI003C544BC5
MNEFELRRELRGLRADREPEQDLWLPIARRLQTEETAAHKPARKRRLAWLPLGAAAAIAVSLSAGIFATAMQGPSYVASPDSSTMGQGIPVQNQIERARELATTVDPRLAGAEVVVDAANAELEDALRQQPDAVYLVGLINHTHAQRRKLARLGLDAG